MRRILVHIAVALVAFTIGVTTASILGGLFGARANRHYERSVHVAPPMPAEYPSCPSKRFKAVPVPPVAPVAPIPPVAPKASKETRIRIRRPDGTVRVIELQTEESAERKF
ncbi:MAG TPA: hypothetical protein VEX60_02635 [Pyrinomonadaceae bacterium]|nr:hypothetical protein [Pyrinomonadaceae bacterium]